MRSLHCRSLVVSLFLFSLLHACPTAAVNGDRSHAKTNGNNNNNDRNVERRRLGKSNKNNARDAQGKMNMGKMMMMRVRSAPIEADETVDVTPAATDIEKHQPTLKELRAQKIKDAQAQAEADLAAAKAKQDAAAAATTPADGGTTTGGTTPTGALFGGGTPPEVSPMDSVAAAKAKMDELAKHGKLDKVRSPRTFNADRVRVSGRTYQDVLEVIVETMVEIEGKAEQTSQYGVIDITSEIAVEDNEQGGTKFETSVDSYTSRNIQGATVIECDIAVGDQVTATEPCKPAYELNNKLFHLVVDEFGNITQFAELDGVSESTHFAAVQSLFQTARLLQMIPSGEPGMVPGGKRTISEDFHDEMGHFDGWTKLLGYGMCGGGTMAAAQHTCASFAVNGQLELNLAKLLKKWGATNMINMPGLTVQEASFTAILQWDDDEGLIKSSKATMSIEIQYPNPADKSLITMHVEESVRLASSVTA